MTRSPSPFTTVLIIGCRTILVSFAIRSGFGVFKIPSAGGDIGIWRGGALYDLHGDYTAVSWSGIAVAVLSPAVSLPIRESPLNRHKALAP